MRAVFNALFHNQDDHPKNFAWRLRQDRRWRLAPAFDLTFSDGPMGQHHMDVCGEGAAVGRDHLLRLAREGGVGCPWQKPRSTGWLSWRRPHRRAEAFPIRRATVRRMSIAIAASRGAFKVRRGN